MSLWKSIRPYVPFWFGYVLLLSVVPRLIPVDSSLPNVAASSGYHNGAAYLCVGIWSVLGFLYYAYRGRHEPLPDLAESQTQVGVHSVAFAWTECLVLGGLVFLIYFPPFLASHGHYVEDVYFLNMLTRMDCGDLPYTDFEFLYGPAMIYPAHWWMNVFGFSMVSYFTLIALLQAAAFVAVLRVLQHHVADRSSRYVAFLLIAPFILDTLLGFNYLAWRVLLVLGALLLVAGDSERVRGALLAGLLIGMQISYSLEYGIIALIAIVLIYAMQFLARPARRYIVNAAVCVISSLAVALALVFAMTSGDPADYFSATAHILKYASETGVGNFYFYWTLNSLALFAVMAIAIAAVGGGLAKLRGASPSYGDRLLLGALLFAIGSLRVALQRADIWHITLPFIPLLLVLLLRPRYQLFRFQPSVAPVLLVLIAVAAITRIIGLMPTGSLFVNGVVQGAVDLARAEQSEPMADGETRRYSLQQELNERDPDNVALGRYLASASQRDKPVIFYSNAYLRAAHVGVCATGYSFYPLSYSNDIRPLQQEVEARHDTLVVIDDSSFARLHGSEPEGLSEMERSLTKRIGAWTSSVHFPQKSAERDMKFESWKRNLGDYLIEHYVEVERFGTMVVLARDDARIRVDSASP